jgi:uncharacterized protein YyaL (SSP411 family)
MAMERKPNRLIHEKSPYLLQHAYNPVDWYPWGSEAFEKAVREDKPIFLSIGYSTCHWCHVMAHESFDDPEIAALMNETFVSVKVDREERQDIDGIYMMVCQMLTGSGGWPLTVLMAPDRKPFFAGTYFPKESCRGRVGMRELVPSVASAWRERRGDIVASSEKVSDVLRSLSMGTAGARPGKDVLDDAVAFFKASFDDRRGGFGSAPKFPSPHTLLFLLRAWRRTGDGRALEMVERTLEAMRLGGIYDHVGFGFHRYATDATWFVPHFEKMIYDQALLAMAYAEAFQATGKQRYGATAREIFAYVLRDMTSPEGAFYSAEDADSEGVEGKYYLWTRQELLALLGKEEGEFIAGVYGVEEAGNWSVEPAERKDGTNILSLRRLPGELAEEMGISAEDLGRRLEEARRKLLDARGRRIPPLKDDKILADWNGLMIASLALGARILGEPSYAEAAGRAAAFVMEAMRERCGGRLFHRFREGQAAIRACASDYAFLAWGLLELYEAVFDARFLRGALDLSEDLVRFFWDPRGGGFYQTAVDAEDLIVRQKESYDGAVPSDNSVALLNLLRLGRMTGNEDFMRKAEKLSESFAGSVRNSPGAHAMFLCGIDFLIGPSRDVVIAGRPGSADTKAMLEALRTHYLPEAVVLLNPVGEDLAEMSSIAPFMQARVSTDGKATASVCVDSRCGLPTTDPARMIELLSPRRGSGT